LNQTKSDAIEAELMKEFRAVQKKYTENHPDEHFPFVVWVAHKWGRKEMQSWKRLALLSAAANAVMIYLTFLKG
jgi:3-deoxy-D-arabino-heptulosonate 7-phosphate (DAHP) synthase